MKKICLVTSTRSEYSILKPLIKILDSDEKIDFRLYVTGMHLSIEFGYTVKEIENDGFHIDKKTEILLSSDTDQSMTKAMALLLLSSAEYFDETKPDLLIVLGDRFEIFAIAISAMNQKIPIAHIHGGEITLGAIDDSIRHSISKMSYIHFTSTEVYRKRVIQLGEDPKRVFNVGSLAVEQIVKKKKMKKSDLFHKLNCKYCLSLSKDTKYGIVLHHPLTLSDHDKLWEMSLILEGLKNFNNEIKNNHSDQISYIFIGANADSGGRAINNLIKEYCVKNDNFYFVNSFSPYEYQELLRYSEFLLGNSSSGIIEAPSYGIPVINIGDRQKGREQADTIYNIDLSRDKLVDVMIYLYKNSSKKSFPNNNPYYKPNTCNKIIAIINETLKSPVNLQKGFYDIQFDIINY